VEGQAVTASFDPMLAKLIAFGSDRTQAIARARAALKDTVILGVTTNTAFLERVLAHPAFAAGDTHTDFLDAHAEDLRCPDPTPEALATVLSAATLSSRHCTDTRHRAPVPLASMGAWRN
jgi:propionyl-CoA carboxylase alpha chain